MILQGKGINEPHSMVAEAATEFAFVLWRQFAVLAGNQPAAENGWRGASLSNMFATVLAPFAHSVGQISIALGPDVYLNLRQSSALSMAVHELATNAIKYEVLSTPNGAVQVGWEVERGGLNLRWPSNRGLCRLIASRQPTGTTMADGPI